MIVRPRALNSVIRSQSWRRDCGSSPVVGSSRKSRSGSPTIAQASASRCFWPPDSLPTRASRFSSSCTRPIDVVDRAAALVEAPKQPHRLVDGELLGELRFLELNAEPLAQLALVPVPAQSEQLDLAGIRRQQPFADLDRRRLAGAVRAEQTEAFAGGDDEVEPVDGAHVAVGLAQIANEEGVRTRGATEPASRRIGIGAYGAERPQ